MIDSIPEELTKQAIVRLGWIVNVITVSPISARAPQMLDPLDNEIKLLLLLLASDVISCDILTFYLTKPRYQSRPSSILIRFYISWQSPQLCSVAYLRL